MSGGDNSISSMNQILSRFATLLADSAANNERLHSKTDNKIDRLVDSIQGLTLELRETKKDRQYDVQRMERIEENQKHQGHDIKHLSDTVLLINERQTASNNNKTKIIGWIGGVLATLITASTMVWWGLA